MKHITKYMILLTAPALFFTAIQGTKPVISLHAHHLGASEFVIGLLVAAYAFFPMLLAIKVGKWVDKYGARRMAVLGSIGLLLSLFVPIIYPAILTILLFQLALGLTQVGIIVAYQKTFGQMSGNRDKNIMWLTFSVSLGAFFGPLLSGFSYEHLGFQWTFGGAAVFIMAGLIVTIALLMGISKHEAASNSRKKQVRFLESVSLLKQSNLRKALIASCLVIYSKDIFIAYFPILGHHLGLGAGEIGMIIATTTGMSVLIRAAMYWLVNNFGRNVVLFTTLVLSGLSFALTPFFPMMTVMFLLAALLGAGLGLGQPLSIVYLLNFSEESRHGEVLGLRVTLHRAAQFTAPVLLGLIGGTTGSVLPIFLVNGALLFTGAFGTWMREEKPPENIKNTEEGM